MIGYKVLTHDYRPPVRGGAPIFDGATPWLSPPVACDPGPAGCAAGWNFCADLATALRIGGFWPNGRPPPAWLGRRDDPSRRRTRSFAAISRAPCRRVDWIGDSDATTPRRTRRPRGPRGTR